MGHTVKRHYSHIKQRPVTSNSDHLLFHRHTQHWEVDEYGHILFIPCFLSLKLIGTPEWAGWCETGADRAACSTQLHPKWAVIERVIIFV